MGNLFSTHKDIFNPFCPCYKFIHSYIQATDSVLDKQSIISENVKLAMPEKDKDVQAVGNEPTLSAKQNWARVSFILKNKSKGTKSV